MKALAIFLLIFLSTFTLAQSVIFEAELELLNRLVNGESASVCLTVDLLKKTAANFQKDFYAVYFLPGEDALRVITTVDSLVLSDEFQVDSSVSHDLELGSEKVKISLLDAFSLVTLQTREKVLGIYLESDTESKDFSWQVVTQTKVFVVGGEFASTLSVTDIEQALTRVAEKMKRAKSDTEKATPHQPGNPDKPGGPEDPGKPEDTPGKGNGKK